MSRVPMTQKLRLVLIGLIGGITLAVPLSALAADSDGDDVTELEQRISALEDLLDGVDRVDGTIAFHGVNIQVTNGSGSTATTNGLGNVIVGYNTDRVGDDLRSGSHNLVVGDENEWTSHGGLIVGQHNSSTAVHGVVIGGFRNTATGGYAAVLGGFFNEASGNYSSVSGGTYNHASGSGSSVSGGHRGAAQEYVASVSGGIRNTSAAVGASVAGGVSNTAAGYLSAILGGDGVTVTDRFAHWPD